MMIAIVRPDSWNLPLFLHVLGAVALVGAVAATALAAGRSGGTVLLRRVAFWTLLAVVLPSWVLMRAAGAWINSREDIPGDPTWLGIGFAVGDFGLIILLVATAVGWWSTRRTDQRWPAQVVTALASLYLVALLVAVFAMSGKPGA
jgi:formate hydrogenlyase subunit 3/multisubunit Na+/H+ antiporter MnhD subunit